MSRSFLGWPAFPEAAAREVGNRQLRENVRRATGTIRGKRAVLAAERPDWEQLRDSAAAIKDRVLAGLEGYLLQVEEKVTAAGGTVHWARDAAEANRIVTDLVRATGEREIVKVKSMLTEEIGLDAALEAAGISARETDLAATIVQLGDDLPSHVVVPALHRNRAEIRDVFVREMGRHGRPAPEGLTDDPAELAEAARLHLREKFLGARVAVSGANFVVAETGTLVVVESEGNGRMCLTLPDTLISVVGIEKTVPSWQDLEVFLQLLARNATGERMAPYTSTWTGTGDATKWSCDFATHSTAGFSGPGWPSVFPVRCGLPRYVAHGGGSAEEDDPQIAQRAQRENRFSRGASFNIVGRPSVALCLLREIPANPPSGRTERPSPGPRSRGSGRVCPSCSGRPTRRPGC